MLETKRTSIMLAKGSAAFEGGRPLLPFPTALAWGAAGEGASFWDFTLQSTTELGADADARWIVLSIGTLNSNNARAPVSCEGGRQFYRIVKPFPNQASP